MLAGLWPFGLVVLAIFFSAYFYVEATKAGMKRVNWALAGAVMGPMLIPLFTMHRYILMKRDSGYNNVWMQA